MSLLRQVYKKCAKVVFFLQLCKYFRENSSGSAYRTPKKGYRTASEMPIGRFAVDRFAVDRLRLWTFLTTTTLILNYIFETRIRLLEGYKNIKKSNDIFGSNGCAIYIFKTHLYSLKQA